MIEDIGSDSSYDGFISVAADHSPRVGSIEASSFGLRYDPDTGRVLSLVDQRRQREMISPRPGIDLFAFVRERSNELTEQRRYAYYVRDLQREQRDLSCWRPWDPVHEFATRVTDCTVTHRGDRVVLERFFEAPGARFFAQRIILEDESPILAVECEFELEPHEGPQAVYFAVPLELGEGWDAWFDTAGAVVAVDADQLPKACRNWATVESFAAIAGADGGVALLSPDAPLVQLGDFHFGPRSTGFRVPRTRCCWRGRTTTIGTRTFRGSTRVASDSATGFFRSTRIRTWLGSASTPTGSHRRL